MTAQTRQMGGGEDSQTIGREPLKGTARQIELRLQELLGGVAIAFATGGDQFCANVMASRGEDLAAAWARLAARNAGVRRVLERMLAGGEWAEVIMATMPVVALIGWHHGLVPEEVGGRLAVLYGLVPEDGEPAGDPSDPAAAPPAYVPPSEPAPDGSGDDND